jgi:hypothetical protein
VAITPGVHAAEPHNTGKIGGGKLDR